MDKIVSTVYYEGSIYIFTKRGIVYEMRKDHTGNMEIRIVTEINLGVR